jgi:hypothetical protein
MDVTNIFDVDGCQDEVDAVKLHSVVQVSSASQRGVVKTIVNNKHDNKRHFTLYKPTETHHTAPKMATPSHARKPSANSRPTTPLRPPSRTSLRESQTTPSGPLSRSSDPLASLEPAFAELSDSMADLEANFMHLQLLNESLNRFNECFGGFLYGLNMSAFCVDFPEV